MCGVSSLMSWKTPSRLGAQSFSKLGSPPLSITCHADPCRTGHDSQYEIIWHEGRRWDYTHEDSMTKALVVRA